MRVHGSTADMPTRLPYLKQLHGFLRIVYRDEANILDVNKAIKILFHRELGWLLRQLRRVAYPSDAGRANMQAGALAVSLHGELRGVRADADRRARGTAVGRGADEAGRRAEGQQRRRGRRDQ